MNVLHTIGYEGTSVDRFLRTLRGAAIDLLVDVRAVARSRKPGFAKTALAANLDDAGIDYLHLRDLGTPPDGRAAARDKRFDDLRRIYTAKIRTAEAQAALETLADLVQRRSVCILCYEEDPTFCHRSLIVEALEARMPLEVAHLFPNDDA